MSITDPGDVSEHNAAPKRVNSLKQSDGSYQDQGGTGDAAHVHPLSMSVDAGGNNERITISTTTVESSAISGGTALVYASIDCFVRQGATGLTAVVPVADISNGDKRLLAGNQYIISGITEGNVLGFITESGSGYAEINGGV